MNLGTQHHWDGSFYICTKVSDWLYLPPTVGSFKFTTVEHLLQRSQNLSKSSKPISLGATEHPPSVLRLAGDDDLPGRAASAFAAQGLQGRWDGMLW